MALSITTATILVIGDEILSGNTEDKTTGVGHRNLHR